MLTDSVNKLIDVSSEGKKSIATSKGELAMPLHKVSALLQNSLWLDSG